LEQTVERPRPYEMQWQGGEGGEVLILPSSQENFAEISCPYNAQTFYSLSEDRKAFKDLFCSKFNFKSKL
jgi:hypothetical protein